MEKTIVFNTYIIFDNNITVVKFKLLIFSQCKLILMHSIFDKMLKYSQSFITYRIQLLGTTDFINKKKNNWKTTF